MSRIKKPWCVLGAGGIGKIESEGKTTAWIRLSEERSLFAWKKSSWIGRFKTIRGAIKKSAEMKGICLENVAEVALLHFPSERKAIEKLPRSS